MKRKKKKKNRHSQANNTVTEDAAKRFWPYLIMVVVFFVVVFLYLLTELRKKTIISSGLCISLCAVASIVIALCIYAKTQDVRSRFLKCIYCSYSVPLGMVACWLFLLINYMFADWDSAPRCREYKITFRHSYHISYRSHYAVRLHCYAEIEVEGDTKVLTFPENHGDIVEISDSVVLKQHRGAFGFDVFNDYYLK